MSKKSLPSPLKVLLILSSTGIFITACSKGDDECTKIITVPESRVGGAYYPAYKMEVPCDFEEPGPLEPSY